MATPKVMIDNEKTRVTKWSFGIGDETGQHIHEFDYVVVPMLDGDLKIINNNVSLLMENVLNGFLKDGPLP
jgi:hypothetical protein